MPFEYGDRRAARHIPDARGIVGLVRIAEAPGRRDEQAPIRTEGYGANCAKMPRKYPDKPRAMPAPRRAAPDARRLIARSCRDHRSVWAESRVLDRPGVPGQLDGFSRNCVLKAGRSPR